MIKMTGIKRAFGKAGRVMKKHSPEILMVTGVVGVITSTVLACKATLKAKEIMAESKKTEEDMAEIANSKPEKYSEDDLKADLKINRTQTVFKIAKAYAIPVALGVVSIAALVTSNVTLRKRLSTVTAAYLAKDAAFTAYRNNVKERYGEEIENEIHMGLNKAEVTEFDEDGNETKKTVMMAGVPASEYAVIFDAHTSFFHTKNKDYNLMLIRQTEAAYQMTLDAGKEHVTLNQIYHDLGLETTPTGLVAGWIYDPNKKIEITVTDVVNEYGEDALLLDFNVDSKYIYETM